MDIHVVQGERELVKDNRSLARFQLKGLPPLAAGFPKIEVEFIIDANGILSVKATELRTSTTASVAVNPSYGLSDTEVEKMLSDSFEYAEKDFEDRFLIEARVEADSLIRSAKKSLESGKDLISVEEVGTIQKSIEKLEKAVGFDDRGRIRKDIELLNECTKHLAEVLLNKAVSEALKGRDLGDNT